VNGMPKLSLVQRIRAYANAEFGSLVRKRMGSAAARRLPTSISTEHNRSTLDIYLELTARLERKPPLFGKKYKVDFDC
jgi:hypothetical protein